MLLASAVPDLLRAAHPWIALAVVAFVFVTMLARRNVPLDLLMLGALVVLALAGVLSPKEAFAGLASSSVIVIGALLVVGMGLQNAGVLDWIGNRLLGSAATERQALLRLALATTAASTVLLNTAVVAMIAPVVVNWCRRRNVSPSKLLMPVSYFAILGGICTLIGTSTNLVTQGNLVKEQQTRTEAVALARAAGEASPERLTYLERFAEEVRPMNLLEIGWVGVPCAAVGVVLLFFVSRYLLPERRDLLGRLEEQRREYLAEMMVRPGCPLAGKGVEEAGLRHLPGLFLIEIDRDGELITPVAPHDVLRAGDRLVFTGVASTIADLEKIPGLVPATDMAFAVRSRGSSARRLTEAVVSKSSPLVGTTVKNAKFRRRYHAAVVAIHRDGERLTGKVGDVELQAGDTLLLQTRSEFVTNYRNSRDFYLVSGVEEFEPRDHAKAPLALAIAGLTIGAMLVQSLVPETVVWEGLLSPETAAVAGAVAMIVSGCLRIAEARQSLELQTLLAVGASLGLGAALDRSGAAKLLADAFLAGTTHPYLLLILLYLLTVVLTEMLSNNAVAAMLFPVAVVLAFQGELNPRPYVMAVTIAASVSFLTPIGYQTNLMVMGPGGYRPLDFVRLGAPLSLAVSVAALTLIPLVWPLRFS